jgi:hypothetical protein
MSVLARVIFAPCFTHPWAARLLVASCWLLGRLKAGTGDCCVFVSSPRVVILCERECCWRSVARGLPGSLSVPEECCDDTCSIARAIRCFWLCGGGKRKGCERGREWMMYMRAHARTHMNRRLAANPDTHAHSDLSHTFLPGRQSHERPAAGAGLC